MTGDPLNRLRHHVSGAIARGEAVPVVAQESPSARYLVHCEERRDNAGTASVREFWHRLAGSVRKAISLE